VLCIAKLKKRIGMFAKTGCYFFLMNNPTYSTWERALISWFWTLVIGVAVLLLFFSVQISHDANNYNAANGIFRLIGMVTVFAAFISLPIVPVAFFAIRWVLAIPILWTRLACALLAVLTFFIIPTLIILVMNDDTVEFAKLGAAYLPASLIATAIVYSKALFRPNEADYTSNAAD
jgi:glucan phosphoethanolaminetransferase (alkaline phosphatase superfamily)